MNLLVVENLEKDYGMRTLFKGVSFGINEGDRIGLLGINGTGKSTLLRIVAGLEESDSGTVTRKNGLRISYLPQNPVFDDGMSILENVINGITPTEGYRNVEGEAAAMLKKLDIADPYGRPSFLSGGQRKRAALIRTLMSASDLLILDEPTNHLDAFMTEWLEEKLKEYKGAILLITHDRYFLDEVTTRILELDRGALYSYNANYSQFIELKAEREDMAAASERKAKSLYKQELAWMLRGARARSTKQKAHIQRFEALRDRKKIETVTAVSVTSAFSRLGKKTIECNSLFKGYDGRTLIKDFSYIFLQNDRVGIIGQNGCGKSTLIKMITGQVQPDSGSVDYGTTVRYGYFAQECEDMDPETRLIDYIRDTAESVTTKEGTITATRMLERFLFEGPVQYSSIGKLSGGERRRLYLLKILMSSPNVLILDEPTNDLDITTLTILEDYLQSFEGIVIAVSHDRYFLDKIVNRIFVFRGDGVVSQVEGNYTDYRDKELELLEERADKTFASKERKLSNSSSSGSEAANATGKPRSDSGRKKLSYNEQREYDTIDGEIAGLEDELKKIEQGIEEAGSDYVKLSELMKKREEMTVKLDERTERWIYLNELVEKMEISRHNS